LAAAGGRIPSEEETRRVQRVFEALFLTRVPRLERPRPDRFGRWPDTYVADAREKGWGTDLPRFHLKENILRVDEKLAAQIADAPAPFWAHVRDALAERHPRPVFALPQGIVGPAGAQTEG